MKATKRFTAIEIVTYRLSNTTKVVSFDTLEQAIEHVTKQRELHPRSNKFNPCIKDTEENKVYHYINGLVNTITSF